MVMAHEEVVRYRRTDGVRARRDEVEVSEVSPIPSGAEPGEPHLDRDTVTSPDEYRLTSGQTFHRSAMFESMRCRRLRDRLAPRILVRRPRTMFQQELDDAGLLPACLFRAAPTSPCRLDGEMQRRRARFVRFPRVRPAVQQRSDRRQ